MTSLRCGSRRSGPSFQKSGRLLAGLTVAALALGCASDPPLNRTGIPYDGIYGGDDWDRDLAEVDLRIDLAVQGRAISPLIYGYNDIVDPTPHGFGSLRAGGNRFSAYNWENNASNAGADYMHQSDGYLVRRSEMGDVPGEAVRPMLEHARTMAAGAIVTVPNVDYVTADKNAGGDVMNTPDYLNTRFHRNLPRKDTEAAPYSLTPDTSDTFVYQDEFVNWAKTMFGDVNVLFSMDNEPDLWSQTHPRIHPEKVTYEEVVRRNVDYAGAVKAAWPEAGVLGFVSYGWNGYKTLQDAPDAKANGDFIDYYLKKMQAAESAAGVRLIDYLDLHWYPESTGRSAQGTSTRIVFTSDGVADPDVVAARVQAPRSLWDPLYREASWIATSVGNLMLIPRMQQKIRDNYPGTKLAMTEWSYGGGSHISGAVATADVLGIFGRDGMDAANIWPTGNEAFTLAAVRAYRNFDGMGGKFGDRSVRATTNSALSSSVYAAIDSADPTRLVVIAINKRAAMTRARITIAGGSAYQTAAVWVLAGEVSEIAPGAPLSASGGGTFTYDMPPLSVSVLVPGPASGP